MNNNRDWRLFVTSHGEFDTDTLLLQTIDVFVIQELEFLIKIVSGYSGHSLSLSVVSLYIYKSLPVRQSQFKIRKFNFDEHHNPWLYAQNVLYTQTL